MTATHDTRFDPGDRPPNGGSGTDENDPIVASGFPVPARTFVPGNDRGGSRTEEPYFECARNRIEFVRNRELADVTAECGVR